MSVGSLWGAVSWLGYSGILSTIYLSLIEIGWHWINTFLIDVVLVYLDWIPITEIIATIGTIETSNIACFNQWISDIHFGSTNIFVPKLSWFPAFSRIRPKTLICHIIGVATCLLFQKLIFSR